MTTEYTVTVLVSKTGKVTVKEKRVKNSSQEIDLSHKRQKKYLLELLIRLIQNQLTKME